MVHKIINNTKRSNKLCPFLKKWGGGSMWYFTFSRNKHYKEGINELLLHVVKFVAKCWRANGWGFLWLFILSGPWERYCDKWRSIWEITPSFPRLLLGFVVRYVSFNDDKYLTFYLSNFSALYHCYNIVIW